MIKLKVLNPDTKEIVGHEWVDEKDGRWKNNCKWASTPDGVVPFNGTRLQYTNHDAKCGDCYGGTNPCLDDDVHIAAKLSGLPCPTCSGTGKIEVYEGDDVLFDIPPAQNVKGIVVSHDGRWAIDVGEHGHFGLHFVINSITVITKGE